MAVGRWMGAPLAAALMVAGLPAVAAAVRPVLHELRLASVRGGRAVVLRFSEAVEATVVPVRGPDGTLQRLQLDLPEGTRLGPGVPRVLQGMPPLVRARVGVAGAGHPRLVLDVVDGDAFVVQASDRKRRISVTVAGAAAKGGGTGRRAVDPRGPLPAAATRRRAEAPPTATVTSRFPQPGARRMRVVLDAGHGGDDPGAIGYVVEKHVTLDVVRRLARSLREELGAEVILTRSSDATTPLAERTAIANQAAADLFVSIHANATPRGHSKGIETYVLDDSNDRATLRLAAIENGTNRKEYRAESTDLRYILSSLVQGGKMPDSGRLASAVQAELVAHMRARYPGVDDLGVKPGPFYVLVGAHMPCILIELSFVSHPVEGRRLAKEAYRVALADGLARGIRRYLQARRQAQTL